MAPPFQFARCALAIIAVGLASALAACSGFSLADINTPKLDLRPLEMNKPVTGLSTPTGPVPPEQLVGADGSCAAAAETVGGIALGMTECDVVSRTGAPENVDVSANERGQRSVVLTYVRGARPGIYRFVGGRLTVIDRAPEPPAPPKPVKVKKVKKKTAKKSDTPPSPQAPPPESVWPPPPR